MRSQNPSLKGTLVAVRHFSSCPSQRIISRAPPSRIISRASYLLHFRLHHLRIVPTSDLSSSVVTLVRISQTLRRLGYPRRQAFHPTLHTCVLVLCLLFLLCATSLLCAPLMGYWIAVTVLRLHCPLGFRSEE